MSLGDGKYNNGGKGSGYNYQLRVLELLGIIATENATICCPTASKEVTQLSILNNVTSKIDRIKGSANYHRTFTYDGTGTQNVTVIVHTGTTLIGAETITETITYVDPTINGSNVTSIQYS